MKILFICGSAEPGKDGVGDYTLRLAAELVRMDNICQIIALNDGWITEYTNGNQQDEATSIIVNRMPASVPWNERIKKAKEIANAFNPQYFSLQYVPFSFHNKGIPFGLENRLKEISSLNSWHIMFHELWVGHANTITQKKYYIGLLQRISIKRLINKLNIVGLTTNNYYYKFLLESEGYDISILPLVSNIPVTNFTVAELNSLYISKITENGLTPVEDSQVALVFGTVPYNWNLNTVLDKWHNALIDNNKTGIILFVGNHGRSIEDLKLMVKENYSRLSVAELGLLSSSEISGLLQYSSFGVNPTPIAISGKSGVIAVMLQHGLPVILTRKGLVNPKFYKNEHHDVVSSDYKDVEALNPSDFMSLQKKAPFNSLNEIATKFLNLLQFHQK